MNVPNELRYSAEHEWAQHLDAGSRVRVGITDYAQDALGDVVYVDLPAVGDAVSQAAESVGELESTKSVSEMYAPVGGHVVAINEALADNPQLLNEDPYGEGWLIEIEVSDAARVRRSCSTPTPTAHSRKAERDGVHVSATSAVTAIRPRAASARAAGRRSTCSTTARSR